MSDEEVVEVAPGHKVAFVEVSLAAKGGFEPSPSLIPTLRERGVRWIVLHPHRNSCWTTSSAVSALIAETEKLRAEGGDLLFLAAGAQLKHYLRMLSDAFFVYVWTRAEALESIAKRCNTSPQ